MDAKTARRPVAYSAGTVILSLVPGDERVALVLNKESTEVQVVPKSLLHLRKFRRDKVLKIQGEEALIEFVQKTGFGTPFGKEEPEDNGSRLATAIRETLEETGSDVSGRIFEDISYTEQPNAWSPYSNTVFLVNGTGFSFHKPGMDDPFVDRKHSGFRLLSKIPMYRKPRTEEEARARRIEHEAGIYQAAIRRIIATLLQLEPEHIRELGRDSDNVEDLVYLVLKRIPYGKLLSQRMLKMFAAFKRLDVVLNRFARDYRTIHNPYLARQIGANLILWFSGENLERGLDILIARTDPRLLGGRNSLWDFLAERFERKEKKYLLHADRQAENGPDETEVMPEQPEDVDLIENEMLRPPKKSAPTRDDYVSQWLGDAQINQPNPREGREEQ